MLYAFETTYITEKIVNESAIVAKIAAYFFEQYDFCEAEGVDEAKRPTG